MADWDVVSHEPGVSAAPAGDWDVVSHETPQSPAPEAPAEPSVMDRLQTNPVIGAPLQTLLRAGQGTEQALAHTAASASDLGGAAPNTLSKALHAIADHVDEVISSQNLRYEQAGERVDAASTNPRLSKALRGTGEVMGNAVNPAGLAGNAIEAAPGVVNAAVRGLASGAAVGASQPVSDTENYWTEKAKQVGIGGLTGAVTGAAVEKLSGAKPGSIPKASTFKELASDSYDASKATGATVPKADFEAAINNAEAEARKEVTYRPALQPKAATAIAQIMEELKGADVNPDAAGGLDAALADVRYARSAPQKGGTIFSAIKNLGGLRVETNAAGIPVKEGQEVLNILQDVPKKGLVSDYGKTPDYMREALAQDGWFRGNPTNGEDINELYDALSQEAQGAPYLHPEAGDAGAAASRKGLDQEMTSAGVASKDTPKEAAQKLAEFRKQDTGGSRLTFEDMDVARRIARTVLSSPDKNERAVAHTIIDGIDKYIDSLNSKEGDALMTARDLFKRGAKLDTVERLVTKAQDAIGANQTRTKLDNALRQQFRGLASNERAMRQFSPQEQDAIRLIVRGRPMQNAARWAGKLSPTTSVPILGELGMIAHALAMGSDAEAVGIAGAAGAGLVGQHVADTMGEANVNALRNTIAGRNALARPRPPPNPLVWNPLPSLAVNALAQPGRQ